MIACVDERPSPRSVLRRHAVKFREKAFEVVHVDHNHGAAFAYIRRRRFGSRLRFDIPVFGLEDRRGPHVEVLPECDLDLICGHSPFKQAGTQTGDCLRGGAEYLSWNDVHGNAPVQRLVLIWLRGHQLHASRPARKINLR